LTDTLPVGYSIPVAATSAGGSKSKS